VKESNEVEERVPALHAVVVTYRRPVQLETTLAAMSAQTRSVDTILVVDNDPMESARPVAERCESAGYLPAGDNLGPAGGIALGLARVLAISDVNDMVMLIDDDDPPAQMDAVERLLYAFDLAHRRGFRCAGVGLAGARYRRSRGDLVRVPDSDLSGLVEVDYLGGGQCPIYLVDSLRSVRGSDGGLFFGLDDADLGLQLRDGGWDLLVPGDLWLEMRQLNGRTGVGASPRSLAPLTPWRQYYSSRNAVHLAKRYGTGRAVVETVLRGLTLVPANRWIRQLSGSSARAAASGTLAGLRGEFGRTVAPR
jgi:hypothetical protein